VWRILSLALLVGCGPTGPTKQIFVRCVIEDTAIVCRNYRCDLYPDGSHSNCEPL